jgi:hypothetical protein
MPLYDVGVGSRGWREPDTRTASPAGSPALELSADSKELPRVASAPAIGSAANPARRPVRTAPPLR